MATCETCRFVHVIARKGEAYEYRSGYPPYETQEARRVADLAQCRIRAPQMSHSDNGNDGWPCIQLDDWCGEHQPKENSDG